MIPGVTALGDAYGLEGVVQTGRDYGPKLHHSNLSASNNNILGLKFLNVGLQSKIYRFQSSSQSILPPSLSSLSSYLWKRKFLFIKCNCLYFSLSLHGILQNWYRLVRHIYWKTHCKDIWRKWRHRRYSLQEVSTYDSRCFCRSDWRVSCFSFFIEPFKILKRQFEASRPIFNFLYYDARTRLF